MLQAFQKTFEGTLRRRAIRAALHQNIQHDTILINGPPEIA
jgi:hypothetical protein